MENVIDLEILHTALYVCKNKTAHSERRVQKNYNHRNKIAHTSLSVQK